MVEHRKVRMDLMSSREVAAYLKTNDMVIQPVGCFEMHGPLIPLACDALNAWSAGILLAEKWGCLVLPPVYYTYPGASGPWPGTMDVSPDVTQQYLKAVALALLKNGFRRVLFCAIHSPLRWMLENVVRSIYQETGQIVLALGPRMLPKDLAEEHLGYPGGEDIATLASLKILGLHGAFDPATDLDKDPGIPFDSLAALWEHRVQLPWTFNADHQHTGIRSCVRMEDADKAIAAMKQAVERMADLPEQFARYQQDMAEMNEAKPWKRDDVWSM